MYNSTRKTSHYVATAKLLALATAQLNPTQRQKTSSLPPMPPSNYYTTTMCQYRNTEEKQSGSNSWALSLLLEIRVWEILSICTWWLPIHDISAVFWYVLMWKLPMLINGEHKFVFFFVFLSRNLPATFLMGVL